MNLGVRGYTSLDVQTNEASNILLFGLELANPGLQGRKTKGGNRRVCGCHELTCVVRESEPKGVGTLEVLRIIQQVSR